MMNTRIEWSVKIPNCYIQLRMGYIKNPEKDNQWNAKMFQYGRF